MDRLNTDLVSIILTTFNGERFLKEQLDSLIAQSYQNIEIIALDDGSTDTSVSILKHYASSYHNITVVENKQNLGYVKNFEKGFLLAKGDYIAPCDQDDIWLANKIEVLINAIGDNAIVYCDSEFIDEQGKALGQKMSDVKSLTDFNNPLMYIEVGVSALGHAMLINKKVVVEALPFPVIFSHDNWLGFVATFNSSVIFVNQVLVQYRRHNANLTNALHKKDRKKLAGKKGTKQQRMLKAQRRLKLLYDKCPNQLPEKAVFAQLCKSYESYSVNNNFLRMCLFFKYRNKILLHKKYQHVQLKRCLHCLKAFFKIM